MPKTIVRENDTLDDALKRFKRDVSRAGTLVEARKRQHYMKPSDVKARLKQLNEVFNPLPDNKKILLKNTIETVAFMDIQLKDLEAKLMSGEAMTPDKQLYSSMAKTRDILMKKLIAELPEEPEDDGFDEF